MRRTEFSAICAGCSKEQRVIFLQSMAHIEDVVPLIGACRVLDPQTDWDWIEDDGLGVVIVGVEHNHGSTHEEAFMQLRHMLPDL